MPKKSDTLPIDHTLAELAEETKAVTAKIIALEKSGITTATEAVTNLDVEALALLKGQVVSKEQSKNDGEQLQGLLRRRALLNRAQVLGNLQRAEDHTDLIRKTLANGAGDELRGLARQAAIAVATLRRVRRDVADLREKLSRLAVAGNVHELMPLNPDLELLGMDAGDFLSQAVTAGLVSQKDLDNV